MSTNTDPEPHLTTVLWLVLGLVAATLTWVFIGGKSFICHMPPLTKENYVEQKLHLDKAGCLFVKRS